MQMHLIFYSKNGSVFVCMENVISHSPETSLVLNNGKESEKYKNVTTSINMT